VTHLQVLMSKLTSLIKQTQIALAPIPRRIRKHNGEEKHLE